MKTIEVLKKLKNQKITKATLKSFIRHSDRLFVQTKSSFDGMSDCVMPSQDKSMKEISKEKAIGHEGVWLVGGSRNSFKLIETPTHFGIEVYNCCGCSTLFTEKN